MLDEIHQTYCQAHIDNSVGRVHKAVRQNVSEDQYEALELIERELGVSFSGQGHLQAKAFIDYYYSEAVSSEMDNAELMRS